MKWGFDPLLFVLFSLGPWLTALFTARFYSDQLLNWYSIYFPFHLPYLRFGNSECYLNNIPKTTPQAVVRQHSGYLITLTFPALERTNKCIYRWKKMYHSSVTITWGAGTRKERIPSISEKYQTPSFRQAFHFFSSFLTVYCASVVLRALEAQPLPEG